MTDLSPDLWPHQRRGIEMLRVVYQHHQIVLMVAPTGAGKTRLGAEMCQLSVQKGNTVLWVVHSTELVDQANRAFTARGLTTGIIQADRDRNDDARIQIGTIQTLERRLDTLPEFTFIIFDEAHLHLTPRAKRLLARFPNAFVLGLSATPTLLSGRELGELYTYMVPLVKPSELIAQGVLMEPIVYAPQMPDLRNVPIEGGDYEKQALEFVCSTTTLIGGIAQWYGQIGKGRQAVLFAVSKSHSKLCCSALRDAGWRAEHADSDMPMRERDEIVARFKRREFDVLCNVNLFTTGFDYPELEGLILARPTKSEALHVQMGGRAIRRAEGKGKPFIIDHTGNTLLHGFCHADRDWQLRKPGDKKPAPTQTSLRTCLQCFAVYLPNSSFCPECLAVPPPDEREVKHKDGMLSVVTSAPTPQEKRLKFDELCQTAIRTRLSRYWVKDKFKKLYGHVPMVKREDWPKQLPVDRNMETQDVYRIAEKYGRDDAWIAKELKRRGL